VYSDIDMTTQKITIRVKFLNLRRLYEVLSNFQTLDVNVMVSVAKMMEKLIFPVFTKLNIRLNLLQRNHYPSIIFGCEMKSYPYMV
jgi:hypothetical protein